MASAAPRTNRLELWLLIAVPAVLAGLVFAPGFSPDPDAGYHVGCARLYGTQGWISGFPWLGYTALGPRFPNVHLLQHLLLAPIALLLDPIAALGTSMVFLSTLLALSVYLVLRRWGVPWAAAWTVLGLFGSEYLVVCHTSLRGGSAFSILLVWFIAAVWSRSVRWTFVLAWLSVYTYVGATILLPVALVFLVVHGLWERSWPWRLVAATVLGILCGMVVNPFWPDHWYHTTRELLSVFEPVTSPLLRGGEWLPIDSKLLAELAGPFLAAWFVLVVVQLSRRERVSARAAAGLVVSFGLFGVALLSGAKMLYLFLLASALFVPLFARELSPWPGWMAHAAVLFGLAVGGWNVRFRYHNRERFPPARDYRTLAELLERETAENEVVLAPWDDFGGLFLFDRRNRYVAGLNMEFLRRTDLKRYDAYCFLYAGQVEQPERVLQAQFDARVIIVRRAPRGPSDQMLVNRLEKNEAFEELEVRSPSFRVFRLRERA